MNADNVSVAAFFAKWTGDGARALVPTAVVLALLAGVMLAVVIRGRGLDRAPVLEMAMVLTLIPLVSPMGWDYTFLMALLAVTLLVNYFDVLPGPARAAAGRELRGHRPRRLRHHGPSGVRDVHAVVGDDGELPRGRGRPGVSPIPPGVLTSSSSQALARTSAGVIHFRQTLSPSQGDRRWL